MNSHLHTKYEDIEDMDQAAKKKGKLFLAVYRPDPKYCLLEDLETGEITVESITSC